MYLIRGKCYQYRCGQFSLKNIFFMPRPALCVENMQTSSHLNIWTKASQFNKPWSVMINFIGASLWLTFSLFLDNQSKSIISVKFTNTRSPTHQLHFNKTCLTPTSTPRVSYCHILNTIQNSKTDCLHCMIQLHFTLGTSIDTTFVIVEIISHCKANINWLNQQCCFEGIIWASYFFRSRGY